MNSKPNNQEHLTFGCRAINGLCLLAVLTGCWGSDLHRVGGRVSFADGSPLSGGRVVVDYGNGKMAAGRINTDGFFSIGTLKETDGMKAGTYRVAIKDALAPKSADSSEFYVLVHQKFTDPMTSGLEFTVPDERFWKIVVERP